MNNENKWLSFLGLAARARKLVTGEETVVKEIRRKSVLLVLVSADASEQTKKKMIDKCTYYNVPIRIIADRHTIGRAIGKDERVVVGVVDEGFAKRLITLID